MKSHMKLSVLLLVEISVYKLHITTTLSLFTNYSEENTKEEEWGEYA